MACKRMVSGMNKEMVVCQMPENHKCRPPIRPGVNQVRSMYEGGNCAFAIIPKANVNQWPGYSVGGVPLFDFLGIWKSSRKAGG